MVAKPDWPAVREKLEAQRAPLAERVHDAEEKLRSSKGRNPDHTDLAQDFISRERRLIMLRQARDELAQVDAALARLAAGTYGQCAQCGEAIDPGRLEVLPYAELCVRCQERRDGAPRPA